MGLKNNRIIDSFDESVKSMNGCRTMVMEFLVEALKDNAYAVLTILMLHIVRSDGTSSQKTVLIYFSAGSLVMLGQFLPIATCAAVLIALFFKLEYFDSDSWKLRNLNLLGKILDYLFRLIFIDGGLYFLCSMMLCWLAPKWDILRWVVELLSCLSLLMACTQVSREAFKISSMQGIIDSLQSDHPIENWEKYAKHRDKFDVLCHMEDRAYFSRSEFRHLPSVLDKIKDRFNLAKEGLRKLDIVSRLNDCRLRGFSTIEMQLVSNIGLEFGSYQFKWRRKAFEILYTHLIFNSFLRHYEKKSSKRTNYRYWLIRNYIDMVPIKMTASSLAPSQLHDGQTTCSILFGKGFEELTCEEFFVWCLGLPHYQNGVGPRAVANHFETIEKFALDETKIFDALNTAKDSFEIWQDFHHC